MNHVRDPRQHRKHAGEFLAGIGRDRARDADSDVLAARQLQRAQPAGVDGFDDAFGLFRPCFPGLMQQRRLRLGTILLRQRAVDEIADDH